ncbi:MAG: Tad domain-containing protein [Candidatus Melainabacteria bacterium]|nr:Tad domain-containing protein [Candidatus Melainabacteria bacterium]
MAVALIVVIIGLGAIVVDISEAYVNQTKIKNAIDSSALAGISQLVNPANIPEVKNVALNYLNSNLIMTLPSFTPLDLSSEGLLLQAGIYNFSSMTFTTNEVDSNVNAIMISYTYNFMTLLSPILGINNLQVSDTVTAAKQTAGRMSPGGGFPLVVNSSVLSDARINNNMIDLFQAGTANSFFTAFMDSSASSNDINQIISYFIDMTTGVEPPSLTVGDSFQINNGNLTTAYMNLASSAFIGKTFVSPIVSLDVGFTNKIMVEGFVGFIINNIYMIGNDYHIAATIIPAYIDNKWSGLILYGGSGNINPQDKPLLAASFSLVQ